MSNITNSLPDNPDAQLKVIGLGLGRTGTYSLCHALETLGFGPCHHPLSVGFDLVDWGGFAKATKGDASPQVLNSLYGGYVSAVDNCAAMLAEPIYKTYPNAKFILTVRDPVKWAESMRSTILNGQVHLKGIRSRLASETATEGDKMIFEKMKRTGFLEWNDAFFDEFHKGFLEDDPEGAIFRHNQFVMQLIPPEKLLVFNVAEGWEPLTKFLDVATPNEPFPRLNETSKFVEGQDNWMQKPPSTS